MILDRSNPDQATVELFVDRTSDGQPFFEEVPVEPLGGERYRILASPGLLDGLAAGDVFDRRADGTYAIVERSGNLCVQVWHPGADVRQSVNTALLPGAVALGGWLDGRTEGSTVLTFPLDAGFQRIEQLLDDWVDAIEGSTWSTETSTRTTVEHRLAGGRMSGSLVSPNQRQTTRPAARADPRRARGR